MSWIFKSFAPNEQTYPEPPSVVPMLESPDLASSVAQERMMRSDAIGRSQTRGVGSLGYPSNPMLAISRLLGR